MPERTPLHVCSAGAAQGLIERLRPAFEAQETAALACEFANVGATFERVARGLGEGAGACALTVLTPPLLARLREEFGPRIQPAGSLGFAATGLVAAEDGQDYPIDTADALRQTLASLDVLLAPDMENSTGGRQLLRVIEGLGLRDTLAPRIRGFSGGAEAMQALAEYRGQGHRVLACAQRTEAAQAQDARFLGGFPAPLALVTEYVVAVVGGPGAATQTASRLAAAMTGAASLPLRQACGFTAEA